MTYAEKLKDPRWQKKRLRIMERDGFKCRDCGSTESTLHVHHCHYEKGDPWDTSDDLLLTLCESCHGDRAIFENEAREAIGIIFSRLPNNGKNIPGLLDFCSVIMCASHDPEWGAKPADKPHEKANAHA